MRDMVNLEHSHPDAYRAFCEGFFVVNKSQNPFSMISIDHNHEQANRTLKEEGGPFILEGEDCVLTEVLISGPEKARLIKEFESLTEHTKKPNLKHHDSSLSVQRGFLSHVNDLVVEFKQLGNPFLEDELLVLHTHEVLPESVGESLFHAEASGREQYNTFVQERLEKREMPIDATISSNNILRPGNLPRDKKKDKETNLKGDIHLLGKLYIALQTREGNADKLFEHENTQVPPSLSRNGRLRDGSKAPLVTCLEDDYSVSSTDRIEENVDAVMIDGARDVHILNPTKLRNVTIFDDYASKVFIPHILKLLENARRCDIIWDRYLRKSLKDICRANRGTGVRTKVFGNGKIPSNWESFLRNKQNKQELFYLLAGHIFSYEG